MQNRAMVEVTFFDSKAAQSFSEQLLAQYSIGNQSVFSEPRKFTMSDIKGQKYMFTLQLSANEFNTIYHDDNAFAELVSSQNTQDTSQKVQFL